MKKIKVKDCANMENNIHLAFSPLLVDYKMDIFRGVIVVYFILTPCRLLALGNCRLVQQVTIPHLYGSFLGCALQ